MTQLEYGKKLNEYIQNEYHALWREYSNSTEGKKIIENVRAGKATFDDAYKLSEKGGKILSECYNHYLKPDEKITKEALDQFLPQTMEMHKDYMTNSLKQIQKSLNEKAKIGLNPVEGKSIKSRIDGLISKITSYDNFEDAKWLFNDPIVNTNMSVVDNFIKANAEFQYKSGLEATLTRVVVGNCCKWCKNLAGKYSYPDVPDDVYRRHENCRCIVRFIPSKKARKYYDGNSQDVWTKKWD